MNKYRLTAIIIVLVAIVTITIKTIQVDRDFAEFSTYIVK